MLLVMMCLLVAESEMVVWREQIVVSIGRHSVRFYGLVSRM